MILPRRAPSPPRSLGQRGGILLGASGMAVGALLSVLGLAAIRLSEPPPKSSAPIARVVADGAPRAHVPKQLVR